MPFLVRNDLPTSTVNGNTVWYFDATRLDQLLAQFGTWQGNVNANDFNLSGLGTLTFGAAGGFSNGSVASPSVRFALDTDTGIYGGGANILCFATGGVRRLQIHPTGNVGIGLSDGVDPSEKIHVNGNARVNGDLLFVKGSSPFIGSVDEQDVRFGTFNAERMRILANGNVGIGVVPTHPLDVNGAIRLRLSSAAGAGAWLDGATLSQRAFIGMNGGAEDTHMRIWGAGLGANVMVINLANGRVSIGDQAPSHQLHLTTDSAAKPTSNTWTIASDLRCKKDIEPFTDGLATILQLQPKSYKLNGKAGNPNDAPGISIIAQDVLDLLPDCIGTWEAKLEPDDEEMTEMYSFNSSNLTWRIVNAIKELAARVEALEA